MRLLGRDPAHHLVLDRDIVAVWRFGPEGSVGFDAIARCRPVLSHVTGARGAQAKLLLAHGLVEGRDILRPVARSIGVGDVPGDHRLTRRGMIRQSPGKAQKVQIQVHVGLLPNSQQLLLKSRWLTKRCDQKGPTQMTTDFRTICQTIRETPLSRRHGRIAAVRPGSIDVTGLGVGARAGDRIDLPCGTPLGEIIALDTERALVMTYADCAGLSARREVVLRPDSGFRPDSGWQGRIVDAFGEPLDGRPLARGQDPRPLRAAPPPAAVRRGLGARIRTGVAAIDTMLPLVRGQRIGIFAGSGVGKSTLLASIAREAEADRIVIGLVGERGRELRHFADNVLGPEGLQRSVVMAATSDQSPLLKRRAAWATMAVAEYFRDRGEHVLLILDSLTRMAEAHRDVALTAGEPASLRAFPPSTGGLIAALCERAGPGAGTQGDITAVFSVLVAGSDMEEPVADMARGVLDGHIVLDREIAERGRFPAIDVRRSVSRSLPEAADPEETRMISLARKVLGTYETAAPMVQAGLYVRGSDPDIDAALRIWPRLDALFARTGVETTTASFAELAKALDIGSS